MKIFAHLCIGIFMCINIAHANVVVQTEQIDSIDLDFIGNNNGSFENLWQNESFNNVIINFSKTFNIANSPYNIKVLSEVFLGAGGAKNEKHSLLFIERAKQLVVLDKLAEAKSLLDMVSKRFWTAEIAELYTNILFLEGKNNSVCMNAGEFLENYKTRYFEEVHNFCLLLHEQKSKLAVGLTFMEERYNDTSLFQKVATKTDEKITPTLPISGFEFALYNHAKITIVKELALSKNLWAIKILAQNDIAKAKEAINLGIISADSLSSEFLKQIKPEFSIDNYKKIMRESENDGLYYLAPLLYKTDLKSIEINNDNMKYAGLIIKSLLLMQEYTLAFEWFKKSDYLANYDAINKKTATLFAPIFKILFNYGQSDIVIINKYKLLKDTTGFNPHQTLQEEKIISNIIAKNMQISDAEIASAVKRNQKGRLIFLCLEKLQNNPFIIDEAYFALIKLGYDEMAKVLAVDTLIKTLNFDG